MLPPYADGVTDRLRGAFLPFHYPGRDRRYLAGLPAGELRRYNLLWLGRPRSWAGVGGGVLVLVAAVALSAAPAWGDRAAWAVVAVVFLPYWLAFNHFEGRLRRRLIERDHPTLCRSCGYDRRGSPGRCPECGAADWPIAKQSRR